MSLPTGIEPPNQPAAPPQLVFPLTVTAPPPSRAPMLAGLITLVVVVSIGLVAAVFAASDLAARTFDSSDLAAAEQVVRDLDSAFENADCDAFEAATTADARDEILDTDYDCDAFEAAAAVLNDGNDYVYSVAITGSRKRGETVTVSTEEAFGDEDARDYSYLLERDGGQWLVTAYGEQ